MSESTLPSAEPNSVQNRSEKTSGHKGRIQSGSIARGRFRSRGRGSSNSSAHDRDRANHPKSGARGNGEAEETLLQAETHGNAEAVRSDDGAEIAQLKRRYRSQLATCRAIVPDWTDDDLLYVLQESSGEVEIAISRIMEGHASQWGEVKKKKEKKKEAASASTSGFGDWPDTFSTVDYGAGRGRGRGLTDRPSRGGTRGRGRGRASDSANERSTSMDQPRNGGGAQTKTGGSSGGGGDDWNNTTTSNGFGDDWGGTNDTTQKWDDPTEGDSAPNVYDEVNGSAAATAKGRQQLDIQSTGGWSDAATKASSIAGGGDHGTEANSTPKSSIIQPTSKSSWASILRPIVPPPTSTKDDIKTSIASPLSENISSTSFNVDNRPPLTSQNLQTAGGLEDQPLDDSEEGVLIQDGMVAGLEDPSSTMSKPVPTRSASYQRRLNQQAAVIMPSGAQTNPVERVGVQFGSLGLPNHREPEEINDVPRTSIQSPSHQYAESRLHHEIGLPYSSRQAQAPQRVEEQNVSHIPGMGANLPPQLNRFGGNHLPPVPSQPQPPRSYDPFGGYGGYSLPPAQSPAGYGGVSQHEEYQDHYRQEPQKGSFSNYHQPGNYGHPPSVPSTASLEASKPTNQMPHEEVESRYFPQSSNVDDSRLHPTLSSHGSGLQHHAPSAHQLAQQPHQSQAQGFPVQQQFYNPYAYYMNPQYGYGYGQQYGNKQAPFNHQYAPQGNYADGQPNFIGQSRGASASEYGQPSNASNAQIPEFLHSEYADPRGVNDGDMAQAGDRRLSQHAGPPSQNAGKPNAGQQQPQYGQQHQPAQPGYSMYSGGFGGYPSSGGTPQQHFQQVMHRQQSQEHSHHSPQPQMPNQRTRNAQWGQYGAQN